MSMVEMNTDTRTVRSDLPTQNSDVDCSENQGSDAESVGKQISVSTFIRCQNGEEESDKGSEGHNLDNNPRKKKHRRGKKRWKPYTSLTWSERQAVDEIESRRATKKREEAFASGHPRAPFNTTQFLIEDHITYHSVPSPSSRDEVRHGKDPSTSCDSSEDYESTDEEKNFIAREFSETYDNIHAERLQTMSKECLIREYIELESKLEQIQTKMKEKTGKFAKDSKPDGHYLSNEEEFMDCEKRILRDEIQKLLAENERLKAEVERLKAEVERLKKASSSSVT